MAARVTLFDGRESGQRVIVWVADSGAGGIQLGSHDIGPALEAFFGKDEIETYLTLGAAGVARLVEDLAIELDADVSSAATVVDAAISLIGRRYTGDSAATSHLRLWLEERLIPYEFHVV